MSDFLVCPLSTRRLPPGFAEDGFDGDVGFTPAFDDRDGQYGIKGLDLVFWLRGPKDGAGHAFAAVSWVLMTGCFLPKTQTEWLDPLGYNTNESTAGALDFHSSSPTEGIYMPCFDCTLFGPGRACYGDSQYLLGDKAYEALVTGGETALWVFLREMYDLRFTVKGSDQ